MGLHITYIPTHQGWLYLAGVMDLFQPQDRRLEHGTRMPTDLVSAPCRWPCKEGTRPRVCFTTATAACSTPATITNGCFKAYGIQASMSRRGDCYDNAAIGCETNKAFWRAHLCKD